MDDSSEKTRLSINFHETFAPEREYIGRILEFAASGDSDTLAGISQKASIPMGVSSGKVNPTLKYSKAMGSIDIKKDGGIIKPRLTNLGSTVFKEDKFLGEALTQWVLHLNLCRKWHGAEIWYRVFTGAVKILGREFEEDKLEKFLQGFYGVKKRRLIGPSISMYSNDSYFGIAGCIKKEGKKLKIVPVPLNPDFFRGYCLNILSQWELLFPDRRQLTLEEFEGKTGFFATTGWSERDINSVIEKMSSLGAIKTDRHLGSPILTRLVDSVNFSKDIYKDLI